MRDFANSGSERWLQLRAAEVCFAIALSPAFAWMAPFDTTEGSFLERLAFWGGLLSSWFVVLAVTEARLGGLPAVARLSPPARQAAMMAAAALPMILITGMALESLQGWEVSVGEVSELYVQIITIGAGVTLLGRAILPDGQQAAGAIAPAWREAGRQGAGWQEAQWQDYRGQAPLAAPEAPGPAADAAPLHARLPALVARLPAAVRGTVLCLEMEDHYVRVHTARGSALLLLRLGDAIEETRPLSGRQVHRSWWIADAAVETFERRGRVGQLRLSNGQRVPVSQRYLREVQSAFAKTEA